jgi:hypothetical protein
MPGTSRSVRSLEAYSDLSTSKQEAQMNEKLQNVHLFQVPDLHRRQMTSILEAEERFFHPSEKVY